jgi:hypothetical protein
LRGGLLDHATRRWAKIALECATDDGATALAEVNAVRAEVALPPLDREEALSYGEGGG